MSSTLERLGKRGQDRVLRVEEDDPRAGAVEVTVVALARPASELRDLTRDLDTCRPRSDDRERQLRVLSLGSHLGHLESAEDPFAQLKRVVDRLQARRVRRDLVVPEVRLACTGGDDQAVVRHA